MKAEILVSLRTYSLSQKKALVKWHTILYELPLYVPDNYEVRVVEAELKDVPLEKAIHEFNLQWNCINDIRNVVHKSFNDRHGLVDIAVFADELHVAFIVDGYKISHKSLVVNIRSIELLKEKLLDYAT